MPLPGYRQASNILYLLGPFYIADSLLVISLPDTANSSLPLQLDLFVPEISQREAIFNGAQLDPETIKNQFNLNSVHSIANFSSSPFASRKLLTPEDFFRTTQPAIADTYNVQYSVDVDNAFRFARQIKTPAELLLLKYASQITAWSHLQIEKILNSRKEQIDDADLTETTVAAAFKYFTAICGARLQAYFPIVGSGTHGSVLHYPTGEFPDEGYTPIERGSFVLIDAAGEYRGYASDLTRTYTRGGEHLQTKQMKSIHKIVAKAQRDAMDQFRNGNKWSAVIAAASISLTQSLLDKGYLIGDLDTLLSHAVVFTFMPHSIGHRVGLDVHDPVPIAPANTLQSTQSATAFVSAMRLHNIGTASNKLQNIHSWQTTFDDLTLSPGSVMTIEPGVYLIPYYLDIVRKDPVLSQFINWEKIEHDKLVEVGGVRIEDVLAIDTHGSTVVLTDLDA